MGIDNFGPMQLPSRQGHRYIAYMLHKEYRYPYYAFNNNEQGFAPTFVRDGLDFFTQHDVIFQAGSMDKRFNIATIDDVHEWLKATV